MVHIRYVTAVLAASALLLPGAAGAQGLVRKTEKKAEKAETGAQDNDKAAGAALNAGVKKYQAKDLAGALADFEKAVALDPAALDYQVNIGIVQAALGNMDAAEAAYAKVLGGEGTASDQAWASAYSGLLSRAGARFNANELDKAERMFMALVTVNPQGRDARYNWALALYKTQRWEALEKVGAALVESDPLNENARIMVFTALREQSDAARKAGQDGKAKAALALQMLEAADKLPVKLVQLLVLPETGAVTLKADVEGKTAAAGTPVKLAFTLYSRGKETGAGVLTVPAPAMGASGTASVKVPVKGAVDGWQYRVMP
jgi:tetratricopeptide (TPR) repeat protein